MQEYLKAVKVTDNTYWVGAIDWNIRNFHGYATECGTTYNAFLVMDEKITLIDTVKAPFYDQMMARISSVVDPSKIDYIVSNHAEMDHSGALPQAVRDICPEKLFASPMGEKNLNAQLEVGIEITAVKTGDSISIGKNSLSFIQTAMLHWPDSMMTYLSGDNILFTQDAFGMHLSGTRLYYDEYDQSVLDWESEKYFANIIMPYSGKVLQLLKSLPEMKLDVRMFCPDHGPLMRRPEDMARVLGQYAKWARQYPVKRVTVIYDTMWHASERMASSICDGARSVGVDAEEICMRFHDRSYVATMVSRSGAIAVGSPTLNNNLMPTMADVMTYLRGLKPQHKIGFSFGSFGWSGESVSQLNEYLAAMKVEMINEGLLFKYSPTAEELKQCFDAGAELANKLIAKIENQEECK